MAIYAVHCPALDRDPQAAFELARTVKQGFAFWGLVFGPLWLLFHGLWLALAAWILGAAIVGVAVVIGVLSPFVASALYVLSAVFIGLHGRMLHSAWLTWLGRPLSDIVTAPARVDAERGFLARALAETPIASIAPRGASASSAPGPGPRGDQNIIGLFPEAGSQ
jgi:hypothetical protein